MAPRGTMSLRLKVVLKVAAGLMGLGLLGIGVRIAVGFAEMRAGDALLNSIRIRPVTMTDSTASFMICNSGTKALHKVAFRPEGFNKGHSSAHPIEAQAAYFLVFASDAIVPAGNCVTIGWKGRYAAFDSMAVEVLALRSAGGTTFGPKELLTPQLP